MSTGYQGRNPLAGKHPGVFPTHGNVGTPKLEAQRKHFGAHVVVSGAYCSISPPSLSATITAPGPIALRDGTGRGRAVRGARPFDPAGAILWHHRPDPLGRPPRGSPAAAPRPRGCGQGHGRTHIPQPGTARPTSRSPAPPPPGPAGQPLTPPPPALHFPAARGGDRPGPAGAAGRAGGSPPGFPERQEGMGCSGWLCCRCEPKGEISAA